MSKNANKAPVRVLMVEADPLMRRGMKNLFALEAGVNLVGEAADGEKAIQLAAQLEPDVVLIDIDLPVINGIRTTRQIKGHSTATRVLALSVFDNDTQVIEMLAAGIDGYCLKSIEWEQLIVVIQLVKSGGTYLDPQIAQKVAKMYKSTTIFHEGSASRVLHASALNIRERKILKLIVEGSSNQKIAEQLYLSLGTVKSYVRTIFNKLSVDDRVQAATKAVREGLI